MATHEKRYFKTEELHLYDCIPPMCVCVRLIMYTDVRKASHFISDTNSSNNVDAIFVQQPDIFI